MKLKKADIPGRWHELASVRAGIFWGGVMALPGLWDSLREVLPWWAYVGGGVALGGTVAAARLLHWGDSPAGDAEAAA